MSPQVLDALADLQAAQEALEVKFNQVMAALDAAEQRQRSIFELDRDEDGYRL